MHDGQNLFDPTKSSFGVDWDVDGVMTKIAKETGLEAIVVGAACNPESISRSHEYDYAFKGAAYADFLIKTLKPMIDRLYPTLTGRESTFVGGSSMGAIISVELAWSHPEIFSKALAFSLPATVHKNSIFNFIDQTPTPHQPVQFYIDHGGWGEDADYKEGIDSFIETMKARGIKSEQIDYAEFPYHDHTEADWSRRLESPLKWLLEK